MTSRPPKDAATGQDAPSQPVLEPIRDDSEAPDIVIEDDDLRMSMGLYEFFMVNGESDAMRVYLHLFYTARRQQTRSVWANTKYVAKGSGMGIGRVKAAKAWLAEKGVIEYRQDPATKGRGKGKVYIIMRTRLSGGTGIRTPDNQDTCSPTHEVLREQEKYQESKEVPAVATLRGRKRVRTPHENDVFKKAAALFEERGGVWAAGTKEAVSLWALIDTAKKQAPDLWEDLLGNLMGIMWALCQGKIPSKGEFWNRAGYTPSMMRSRWGSLLAYIKTKQTPEEYASEILAAVP